MELAKVQNLSVKVKESIEEIMSVSLIDQVLEDSGMNEAFPLLEKLDNPTRIKIEDALLMAISQIVNYAKATPKVEVNINF